MNKSYSVDELIYKTRWIGNEIRAAVKTFPVTIISGARQVGKSTLLQNEFPDFKYITLDDYSALRQAKIDPASLWAGEESRIIVDEAQKAPEIFPEVKRTVDMKKNMRFILSGSSNLLLMHKTSESLAGRAVFFELLPMALGELDGDTAYPTNFFNLWEPEWTTMNQKVERIDPLPLMLRGFMPFFIVVRGDEDVLRWWEGYVRTYLERDLRELSQVDSLIDFRRVMEALSARNGSILNQNEIAHDAGVSQSTVFRYLKILEISNIVQRIPAYFTSRSKRIRKAPKLYFIDPALSIYLSGYHDRDSLSSAGQLGAYFETLVFLHLTILSSLTVPRAKLFYWKTHSGKEVDFVFEWGAKRIAIEVKMSGNPKFEDIRNILSFMETHPKTVRGLLVHGGDEIKWLHEKVLAVPWWWIGR